jgi:hypothetical protein
MPSSSSLSNKALDTLNGHLTKIKNSSTHSIPFIKSFENISKNEGNAFLFLDPSKTHLQIFHHGTVLGGNWNSPTKQVVAILGMDCQGKPVHIIHKSIKNVKEKSFLFEDFASTLEDGVAFIALKNPKMHFLHKNIIAIPIFDTVLHPTGFYRTSVAKAFINTIMDFDDSFTELDQENDTEKKTQEEEEPDQQG